MSAHIQGTLESGKNRRHESGRVRHQGPSNSMSLFLLTTTPPMPPNQSVSLFKDVKNLNIEGGSFNIQNTAVTNHYGPVYKRRTAVRQRRAKDIDALGTVLYFGEDLNLIIHQAFRRGESSSSIETSTSHWTCLVVIVFVI